MDINSLKNWIKDKLSRAADWLVLHKWHIAGLALIALLLCGVWVRHSSTAREISSLRSAYAQSVEQVRALEDEVTSLRVELDRKCEEIVQLQERHDRAIREVTADAYRKARTLSDDELLAAYNHLITGARQRNADRERADTSAEE